MKTLLQGLGVLIDTITSSFFSMLGTRQTLSLVIDQAPSAQICITCATAQGVTRLLLPSLEHNLDDVDIDR